MKARIVQGGILNTVMSGHHCFQQCRRLCDLFKLELIRSSFFSPYSPTDPESKAAVCSRHSPANVLKSKADHIIIHTSHARFQSRKAPLIDVCGDIR